METQDSIWREALDSNTTFLLNNLTPLETFYAGLIEKRILTREMVDVIKAKDTDSARIFELVNFLKKRSYSNFQKFLEVLEETENNHVAVRFKNSTTRSSNVTLKPLESREDGKSDLVKKLSDKLEEKDRKIQELEMAIKHLQKKNTNVLDELATEMNTSHSYKIKLHEAMRAQSNGDARCDEIENCRARQQNGPIGCDDVDKVAIVEDVEDLEIKNNELEEELQQVNKTLHQMKRQLRDVETREQELKLRMGLSKDATRDETRKRLKEIDRNESALLKAKEELLELYRKNQQLCENEKTLKRKVYDIEFDIKQKKLIILRLKRTDPAFTTPRFPIEKVRESKAVSAGPSSARLPAVLPPPPQLGIVDISLGDNFWKVKANEFQYPDAEQTSQTQLPVLRKDSSPEEERPSSLEGKFCLLCRKDYYLKRECMIHLKSIKSGKYTCCNADAKSSRKGCRVVRHMYVTFTGSGSDFYFHDESGRRLDFGGDRAASSCRLCRPSDNKKPKQ